jgi:hypothetical protein
MLSLLMAVFFLPQSAMAQTDSPTSENGDTDGGRSGDFDRERDAGPKLSDPNEVAPRLAGIRDHCGGADVYVVDCLAERLDVLEKSMDQLAGYGDARRILRETAAQLRQITQDNVDENRPKARMASADGSFRSTRPLAAVSAAQKRRAISQAVAILAEAETQLLRSADAASGRAVHYQQIAAALGSNKVLLRSS